MPPILGIIQLNTNSGTERGKSHMSQVSYMSRLSQKAATYITPRTIESLTTNNSFVAAAKLQEAPLQTKDEIMSQHGSWIIVADATLYKKNDSTKPDIEVIFDAWQTWGRDCVKHLYGDFSFVIYNRETGEIFCARDHFGVRPFYYTFHDGIFIFSSELRMILGVLPAIPEIRHDYLLDTLTTVKNKKDITPFSNILRLNPAHALSILKEKITTEPYWQLDPNKKIFLEHENDYFALFREKLIHAVKVRSNTNRLGTELSGGLDSSAIAGIASQVIKLKAFSNVFPSGTGIAFTDEKEFMEQMASFAGIEWIPVDRHSQTIIEILGHTLSIHGTYIQQNFNIFSKSLYEKAAECGIRVLFSGFGGDELVSSRIRIPWNQYIDDRQWRVILDELYHKTPDFKSIIRPLLLASRYIKSKLYNEKYSSGVFTPELLDRRFDNLTLRTDFALKNKIRQRLGDNFRRLRKKTFPERQIDRIMMDHLPQRLEYCYTAAAQYGIEYRYPLLDVDLVETALAFPPWVKQHHGINRYLFREAIKGFVPEEIRLRNDKSGSTIPQTLFSLINERGEILDLISQASGSAYLNEIFDFSKFPSWYEKLVKRAAEDMNYLMPGAFYDYLMILMYYRDREKGTGDELGPDINI